MIWKCFISCKARGEHYQKSVYAVTYQSHTSEGSARRTAREFPNAEHDGERDIPRFSAIGSGAFHMTQRAIISVICTKIVFTNSYCILGDGFIYFFPPRNRFRSVWLVCYWLVLREDDRCIVQLRLSRTVEELLKRSNNLKSPPDANGQYPFPLPRTRNSCPAHMVLKSIHRAFVKQFAYNIGWLYTQPLCSSLLFFITTLMSPSPSNLGSLLFSEI